MTRAQERRLGTIIGKLEALQHEVEDFGICDMLGDAKSDLLRALRYAETARSSSDEKHNHGF